MTAPAAAAGRFLWALALGLLLGLWSLFLSPLARRRPVLADLLFLPGLFWAWLWHSFRLCRGDLRLGPVLGLPLGVLACRWALGRLLLPVFGKIWQIFGKLLEILLLPWKKFFEILKKCVASGEKWVTIKWNNRRPRGRKSGGAAHGPERKEAEDRFPFQFHSPEDRGNHSDRVFYGGADGPDLGPGRDP